MSPEAKTPGLTAQFGQHLTGCQSALYAFIVTLLGGAEGAHDVLQETNLVLWKKAADYDPNQPFLRWAYTFARFQTMAWLKKQSRSRLVLDEELVQQVAAECEARDLGEVRQLEALDQMPREAPGAAAGTRHVTLFSRRTGERYRRAHRPSGGRGCGDVVSDPQGALRLHPDDAQAGGRNMSERNAEFEGLLAAAIDGRADETQLEQLRVLLREDAGLRAEYAAQLQLHALLQWRAGRLPTEAGGVEEKVIPFRSGESAVVARRGRCDRGRAGRGGLVFAAGAAARVAQARRTRSDRGGGGGGERWSGELPRGRAARAEPIADAVGNAALPACLRARS